MGTLLSKLVDKLKNNTGWIKDYLTEISVVVISIAITFWGDGLIENYNNKQDDKEMIEMVKQELESNIQELSDMIEHYDTDSRFGTLLSGYLFNREAIYPDSLDQYYNRHRTFGYWFLKKNAFDIMRVSGTVQRAEKDLLMLLFESYDQLNVAGNIDERYREQRIERLLSFNTSIPGGKHGETTVEQWKQIEECEDFRQYLCNSMPSLARTAMRSCQRAKEIIGNTLERINEEYPD